MQWPPRVIIGMWVLWAAACANDGERNRGAGPRPELMFQNGFGGTTQLQTRANRPHHLDVVGYDDVDTRSDWKADLEQGSPYYGGQQLYMEQGTEAQRNVKLVSDPADPSGTNVVMRYQITEKHIFLDTGEVKARIQHELANRNAPPADGYLKEFYLKIRVYFSPSFAVLERAPTDDIGWIVLQEFRDDPSWGIPNGDGTFRPGSEARTNVEIIKRDGRLRFGAKGRFPLNAVPRDTGPSWEAYDVDFAIPFGTWMTQEIYQKEGQTDGRFWMAVTVDDVRTVIVDQVGMTTSPEPGYVPDGQTSWSISKFYTEGKVMDWFKDAGVAAEVYWDDVEIWRDRTPESIVD